jgi:ABC-2 type transport system permease protein
MSAEGPVTTARAFGLLVRLGARRWLSRLRLRLRGGKKAKGAEDAARTGTARKAPVSPILLGFLAVSFVWGGWVQSVPVVRAAALSGSDAVVVDRFALTMARLHAASPTSDASQRERAVNQIVDILRRGGDRRPDADLRAAADRMLDDALAGRMDRYIVESPLGVGELSHVLPADLWHSRSGRNLRFALLLAFFFVATSTVAYAAVDLAKPEWDLEWLWTTPAPARAILWARFAEYALFNPLAWFVAGPIFCAMLSLRLGPLGTIGGTLLAALYVAVLSASLRVVAEFGLRGRLKVAKNLQALCSVLGIGAFFAVMVAGRSRPLAAWFESAAAVADPIAHVIALPILALDGPRAGLIGAALAVLGAAAAACGAVGFAARSTAGGLVADATGREGRRGAPAAAPARGGGFLRGVVGKDVRLLLRDRNVLVQIVLVPGFVFGLQLVFNRGLADAVVRDPHHAAAAAFGIGAYMLMFCATGVLTGESGALWILYASPHRIDDLLRRKTALWAGLGAAYTAVCLIVLGAAVGVGPALIPHAAVAIPAVVLCAYLAAAIGSLGADPTNPEPTRRVSPWALYAYLLLSSLVALAVYAPSWWQKASTFFFLTLLAVALWQKLRDRIPYLLDPTEAPPPRLSLADGMVAAFAFLVLSGALTAVFMRKGGLDMTGLLAAYAVAGLIVVPVAWAILGRRVVDFATTVGLRGDPLVPARKTRAVLLGAGVGAVAAAFGLCYVRLLEAFPALAEFMQAVDPRGVAPTPQDAVAFFVLAVVAAPLVEEFVFRGLALRGLERSMRPTTAVLLSATLFALVHPLVSLPAVFGLGLATAFVFRRSGLLLAPIVCHAVYNAAIVLDRSLRG